MIARRLALLVLLVIALSTALALLRARDRAGLDELVFPGLAPQRIARVTLGPRGRTTLTLQRDADGAFALAERHGFRAAGQDLDAWLARVAGWRAGPRAGSDPRVAALGLAEEAVEIALFDASGARLASLLQGRADGDASFVAPESGSPLSGGVWRVPRWQRLPTHALAWLDTRLALPEVGRWTRVEIERGTRRLELVREQAGAWSAAGAPVPAPAVERLGELAGALYFADVLATAPAPEHGFAAPRARLRLHADAPAPVELVLGSGALRTNLWAQPFVLALAPETDALLVAVLDGLLESAGGAPSQR